MSRAPFIKAIMTDTESILGLGDLNSLFHIDRIKGTEVTRPCHVFMVM